MKSASWRSHRYLTLVHVSMLKELLQDSGALVAPVVGCSEGGGGLGNVKLTPPFPLPRPAPPCAVSAASKASDPDDLAVAEKKKVRVE